ncbi:hypothetical protein [Streptomyces sp. NBC_01190]|uniref:hypothetical protein n=1 Tax=Streptomyces sp. NBC_01190 TaxID=2903767 RepID=UPI003868B28F|nr:hypothetical protein OG519_26895 [Streptomyces sp. NBC_01190]
MARVEGARADEPAEPESDPASGLALEFRAISDAARFERHQRMERGRDERSLLAAERRAEQERLTARANTVNFILRAVTLGGLLIAALLCVHTTHATRGLHFHLSGAWILGAGGAVTGPLAYLAKRVAGRYFRSRLPAVTAEDPPDGRSAGDARPHADAE